MTKAAIIAGSLVDVRNVGTHKSVKLTIHVPAEHATKVFDCFGWPTGVDPVAVAVARLDLTKAQQPVEVQDQPRPPQSQPQPLQAGGAKKLVQQAGICCADPRFQRFLQEMHGVEDLSEGAAAEFVRHWCCVASRSDIKPGTNAAAEWRDLHGQFMAWRDYPEIAVPA